MSERVESSSYGGASGLPLTHGVPVGSATISTVFAHPQQVVDDPHLTQTQKREILASWASDSRAVPHFPTARQLDSGAVVQVEEIFEALNALDGTSQPPEPAAEVWLRPPFERRNRRASGARGNRPLRKDGSRGDDDDDPPPCPVRAPFPKHGPPPCSAVAVAPGHHVPAMRR